MKGFVELQEEIYRLGVLGSIPSNRLLLRTASIGDGSPHMEMEDLKYCWVVAERGFEFSRQCTESEDELLYWFFDAVTTDIACEGELDDRVEGADPRRKIFELKLSLFKKINPAWERRCRSELRKILADNPFNDQSDGGVGHD